MKVEDSEFRIQGRERKGRQAGEGMYGQMKVEE